MLTSPLALFAAAFSQSGISFFPITPPNNTASWPYGPLVTQGRDMVNQKGDNVVYAGANWPGHLDAMIPEGLQYQSISSIVGKIKDLNMNVIRLTYAIEMIDDIFNDDPDQTLENTLVKALGQENGTTILNQILTNNPQFNENSTRLEVSLVRFSHNHKLMPIPNVSAFRWRCRRVLQTAGVRPSRQPHFARRLVLFAFRWK